MIGMKSRVYMNNKGFTLVEVLAVVAIIAILGLIATPSILSVMNTGKNSSYDIMIGNIKTAAEELYQEIELFDSKIFDYKISSGKDNTIVMIDENQITVNLQTLVSNGFLFGTNNNTEENSGNVNKKIILNPKDNKDIGNCKIIITKTINNGNSKVCYKIDVSVNENGSCPTYDDFGGDSQCTS